MRGHTSYLTFAMVKKISEDDGAVGDGDGESKEDTTTAMEE